METRYVVSVLIANDGRHSDEMSRGFARQDCRSRYPNDTSMKKLRDLNPVHFEVGRSEVGHQLKLRIGCRPWAVFWGVWSANFATEDFGDFEFVRGLAGDTWA